MAQNDVEALNACVAALQTLAPDVRHRVLATLVVYFGAPQPVVDLLHECPPPKPPECRPSSLGGAGSR